MSDEAWKAMAIIVPPLSVLLSRLWSRKEHKSTTKKVNDIYFLINGDLQKRLKKAREEGRRQALKINKKKK